MFCVLAFREHCVSVLKFGSADHLWSMFSNCGLVVVGFQRDPYRLWEKREKMEIVW